MSLVKLQDININAFKGILKITRVHNLFYIAITQYFVAIFLANNPSYWRETISDPYILLLVIATNMIAAAGYFINDYYDVKVDYINRPEKVVVGKYLRRRMVLASHSFLNFAGIGISILIHWKLGAFNFACSFLLWLYSNHLKRLPLIGNVTIALLTSASLIVIGFYYQSNLELIYMYSLFAFSISLIREILKDMEDLQGDKDFGSRTLPIIWGIKKTKIFIYGISAFFISGYIYFIISLSHPILSGYFLCLAIPVAYLLYKLHRADTKKEFAILTDYCKVIMFSGVISMVFF
ncbi:MAG: geranylgeranylglycerol-phosphate geranylgeranyltransferase [Bacteroidota bacterium]|nr:geranylgeranylglycerol-phosphate geranylgeranyltransferase [Bacteroidota bacterium]